MSEGPDIFHEAKKIDLGRRVQASISCGGIDVRVGGIRWARDA